jgi:hypothetical protein
MSLHDLCLPKIDSLSDFNMGRTDNNACLAFSLPENLLLNKPYRHIFSGKFAMFVACSPKLHLFERIEKESEDTCLYKHIFLDYTYGIGKIYIAEEIEKAKQSPSFEREYNLKYLGKIGNVFHTKDIEVTIEKGRNIILTTSTNFTFLLDLWV